MTYYLVGVSIHRGTTLCAYFPQTVQKWTEVELFDIPTCERCGFQGRRPENVSEKLCPFYAVAERRVCFFLEERDGALVRRSLFVN